MEEEQNDMQQRIAVIERERRWMQEQSLRVDQMRVSVNDLVARTDGSRSRRESSDQKIGQLDYAVEKLKEDMEALAQMAESCVPARKWTAETNIMRRALGDVTDRVAVLDGRVAEMQGQVTATDGRHRSQATELARSIGETMRQAQEIAELRNEAQLQIDTVASNQRSIEQSLQSVIHEYNAMLNDHEQAIRALGENQSMHGTQQQCTVRTTRKQSMRRSAPPAPGRKQARVVAARSCSPPPEQQEGESLDDIFANDHNSRALPPSPPLSTSSAEQSSVALNMAVEEAMGLGHMPLRKAVSVVGTSNEPRPRQRPRISSFSRPAAASSDSMAHVLVSPARMTGGFSNIISTTSHVGVGWGNYWEARRHRLQFDIQKRFGLSATVSVSKQPALVASDVEVQD
ncbi:hypothetical protein EV175_000012 [Coemansia sp. RSA 1933]|nr:hypothetical protein EV175_000012 [Coemansia sp. RSA 1933]